MGVASQIACNASNTDLDAWAKLQFGSALGSQVPALYTSIEQPAPLCQTHHYGPPKPGPSVPTTQQWQAAMRSAGDSAILCRSRELLNSAAANKGKAFWYYFTATPITSANMEGLQYYGAFHGAEVPFVFGDQFEISSDGERRLSLAMGCFWTNFAISGDPNTGSSCR
jgi:carboxylesterase type B